MKTPAELEPVYTNMVRISHSPAELVLGFDRFLPGQGMAKVDDLPIRPTPAAMENKYG